MAGPQVNTSELEATKAPNLTTVKDGVGGITGMDTVTPKAPATPRITGQQLIAEASKPLDYTKESYLAAVTPTLKEVEERTRELGEFTAMEKGAKAEALAKATGMRGEALKKEKEAITGSPEYAQMQSATNKLLDAEFVPTKDTAKDLGGLFSLISVIGFAIGGGSKGNAVQALNAMDGMLSGYQKGRADLYKREKDTFDTNFKTLKLKTETLTSRLKQIGELAAIDTKAANAEADAFLAQEDANFVKQYKDKYSLPATIKYLDNLNTTVREAEKLQLNLKDKAQERKLSAMTKVYDTQRAEDLAALKGEGGAKLTSAQINMNQRVINALGGISSVTEQIQKLPAGSTTGILPNLQTKDGMTNFIRNKFFREISKDEARALQILYSGISRNLAAVEASGAATGLVGLAQQMEKLTPQVGDSAYNVALGLADIRRISTEMVVPLINSGLLLPGQKSEAIRLVQKVEESIPYTVNDVVTARFGTKQSIGEKTMQILDRGPSLEDFMTKARQANPGKTDEELTTYYNQKYGRKP